MSPQTRPTTIAKMIAVALDNNKNIELIPSTSEAMPRVTEAMTIAQCEGKFLPEGEIGKMYICCSA